MYRQVLLGIITMREHYVNVVVLETLERALQAFDNMLLAQPLGVGLRSSCSKIDLLLLVIASMTTVGQLAFVDSTYSSRGQASSLKALPISTSHSPFA